MITFCISCNYYEEKKRVKAQKDYDADTKAIISFADGSLKVKLSDNQKNRLFDEIKDWKTKEVDKFKAVTLSKSYKDSLYGHMSNLGKHVMESDIDSFEKEIKNINSLRSKLNADREIIKNISTTGNYYSGGSKNWYCVKKTIKLDGKKFDVNEIRLKDQDVEVKNNGDWGYSSDEKWRVKDGLLIVKVYERYQRHYEVMHSIDFSEDEYGVKTLILKCVSIVDNDENSRTRINLHEVGDETEYIDKRLRVKR